MTSFPVTQPQGRFPLPDATLDDGGEPPARGAVSGLGPDDTGDPDLDRELAIRLSEQDCG